MYKVEDALHWMSGTLRLPILPLNCKAQEVLNTFNTLCKKIIQMFLKVTQFTYLTPLQIASLTKLEAAEWSGIPSAVINGPCEIEFRLLILKELAVRCFLPWQVE